MIHRPRLETAAKALLLLGLGIFLYSRISSGVLFYYINERFAGYTLLAVVGLIAVGLSYRPARRSTADDPAGGYHDHQDHDHHGHDHRLTWGGAALVSIPILLGLLVPPQPLGAAALASREVNVVSGGSSLPSAVREAAQKASTERNILDWTQSFQTVADPADSFSGQQADVIGFVYRDERFTADQFLATRFVVSCCVADAAVVGLVVHWPESAALQADQWVRVVGTFTAGALGDQALPVLVAQSVTPVDTPAQPYLYP